MADIKVIQPTDLDPAAFSNNGTAGQGGISVNLSPDGGNLLQKRNNGFYYGIEAPPDTRNLYVDAINGDDANPGTRAAPLKTIIAALQKNLPKVNFNIYLHEGQNHIWRNGDYIAYDRYVFIAQYGPQIDLATTQVPPGVFDNSVEVFQQVPRCTLILQITAEIHNAFGSGAFATFFEYSPNAQGGVMFGGIDIEVQKISTLPYYAAGSNCASIIVSRGATVTFGATKVATQGTGAFFIDALIGDLVVATALLDVNNYEKNFINIDPTATLTVNSIRQFGTVGGEPIGFGGFTWRPNSTTQTIGSKIVGVKGVATANVYTNVDLGVTQQ